MKAFFRQLHMTLIDRDEQMSLPTGFTDDASRLNQTRITEIFTLSSSGGSAEDQLRQYLQHARNKKLPLSIAGMRHTMGGQTFTPRGLVLNMLGLREMHLDEERNILHVQAGACWSDVLPYLHARQRSLKIMQSNNSFSVGGSLGANCHGWQPASPPIASTVVAFHLLLADGTILRCSREEHPDLFSLVLGGYGLFGIVIDVELSICANACYRVASRVLPSAQYPAFYQEHIKSDPLIGLAYGRFNVEPKHFLREIFLITYHDAPGNIWSPLGKPGLAELRRFIFRNSVGSPTGKALRWNLEKQFSTLTLGPTITRNLLLNESVAVFQNRRADTTDILHEYFVPVSQLESFLEQLRIIIPAYQADLLNVTIRFLRTDHDSFLRYADQEMFALVMLFHQPCTQVADQKMAAMTGELIEAALQSGGRYYLPYRLHANLEQFSRSYPQAQQFFELKRKYDPEEVFQNELYQKYAVVENRHQ
jgi:FAD/FMN-containing dehydrogenase